MNIAPGFLRSAYRDRRLPPSDVMAAARALDRRIADIDTLPLYGCRSA